MATYKEKILVVDDDPDILDFVSDRLLHIGFQVDSVTSGEEALTKIAETRPSVLLLDLQLPGVGGMEILRKVKDDPEMAVIMMTAHGTVENAVKAVKEGAFDFIAKPFSTDHLEVVVGKAIAQQALKRQNNVLLEELHQPYREILGNSQAIIKSRDMVKRVAGTSSTVLLLGENGTGKEVFARSTHRWSPRANQPFVVVNCVALREELLESELFGHEKGAFTGANLLRRGKLEVADGGTVFLDEIGDMKLDLQSKLLRFLQEREFERVGGNKTLTVDVRIIAATNRDLALAVESGQFREDLFFRLNVVSISLPPLRERKDDIEQLSATFLAQSCKQVRRPPMSFSKESLIHLAQYHWPGNVRELKNMIERAVVLVPGNEIKPIDLPLLPAHRDRRKTKREEAAPLQPYHIAVLEHQKKVITKALQHTEGNQSKAASLLGLQRTYLSRLIKQMGLGRSSE
ncbi:MAG: sigma-54 dependent transcriptional regulator [Nitrospirota bacterium]